VHLHDFRDATNDPHRSVDDTPLAAEREWCCAPNPSSRPSNRSPNLRGRDRPHAVGRLFTHDVAVELSALSGFTLLSGRYEGFDQRALDLVADDEISLGDFVLPAVSCGAVRHRVRGALLPGGSEMTPRAPKSRSATALGVPQYTKPATFEARVLRFFSRKPRTYRTLAPRPGAESDSGASADLIARRGGLSEQERALLDEFRK